MRRALASAVLLALLVIWPSRMDQLFWTEPEMPAVAGLVVTPGSFSAAETAPTRRRAVQDLIADDLASWEPEFDVLNYGRAAAGWGRPHPDGTDGAVFLAVLKDARPEATPAGLEFDYFAAGAYLDRLEALHFGPEKDSSLWGQTPRCVSQRANLFETTSTAGRRIGVPTAITDRSGYDFRSGFQPSAVRTRPLVSAAGY